MLRRTNRVPASAPRQVPVLWARVQGDGIWAVDAGYRNGQGVNVSVAWLDKVSDIEMESAVEEVYGAAQRVLNPSQGEVPQDG